MNFIQAIKSAYSNYGNFTGRSSRSELWYFVLYYFLVLFITIIAIIFFPILSDGIPKYPVSVSMVLYSITALYIIAIFIPMLAVSCRRLHDINRSGYWLPPDFIMSIMCLIVNLTHPNDKSGIENFSILYSVYLAIICCKKGTQGGNRFGADPLKR